MTSMQSLPALDTIPQEVLEQIAFCAATDSLLGPPSAIVPLLCTNRKINSYLSFTTNHHLYARIFMEKFDCSTVLRRLDSESWTASVLSKELQRRFTYLKRLRARSDSILKSSLTSEHKKELRDSLWTAYIMMLENDGKNETQLRDYAMISDWLKEYLFDDCGGSSAKALISMGRWPRETEQTSLAMWLLWFLLRPGECLLVMSLLSISLILAR